MVTPRSAARAKSGRTTSRAAPGWLVEVTAPMPGSVRSSRSTWRACSSRRGRPRRPAPACTSRPRAARSRRSRRAAGRAFAQRLRLDALETPGRRWRGVRFTVSVALRTSGRHHRERVAAGRRRRRRCETSFTWGSSAPACAPARPRARRLGRCCPAAVAGHLGLRPGRRRDEAGGQQRHQREQSRRRTAPRPAWSSSGASQAPAQPAM